MTRRTKEQFEADLLALRDMRLQRKPKHEIMKVLGVKPDLYDYYVRVIHKREKGILETEFKNGTYQNLSTLKEILEEDVRNLDVIIKNSNSSIKEKIEAMRLRQETALNLVKLYKEGPDYLNGSIEGSAQTSSREWEAESINSLFDQQNTNI